MNNAVAILKAIVALGSECGTVQVREWIEEARGYPITIGMLWKNLDMLEREYGFIRTAQRPGGPERGNKPRRVCWITDSGLAELRKIEARK